MSYYDGKYSGYLITWDKETQKAVYGHIYHVAEGLAPGAPVLFWDEHAEGWVPKKALKGEYHTKYFKIHSWFYFQMAKKVVQWHNEHPEDEARAGIEEPHEPGLEGVV